MFLQVEAAVPGGSSPGIVRGDGSGGTRWTTRLLWRPRGAFESRERFVRSGGVSRPCTRGRWHAACGVGGARWCRRLFPGLEPWDVGSV